MTNHETKHEEKRELINGVFSSQEVRKVGTGTTSRKTIQKSLWFAKELPDGSIELQPLNLNYVPSGPKRNVTKDEFLETYSPEPEVYVSQVLPHLRSLNKTIARADRHRQNKEFFSAEMEYGNALKVDEENVRANFGLGITYLERGDNQKADNIFERLVKLEAAFEQEHKHLFNEFGINLRRNGLHTQAISYYSKAITLAQHDENLFYNLARAYYENKEFESAIESLSKSLSLNPRLEVSVKFLVWMLSRNEIPEAQKSDVVAMLQRVKQAAAAPAQAQSPAAAQAAPSAAQASTAAQAASPATAEGTGSGLSSVAPKTEGVAKAEVTSQAASSGDAR